MDEPMGFELRLGAVAPRERGRWRLPASDRRPEHGAIDVTAAPHPVGHGSPARLLVSVVVPTFARSLQLELAVRSLRRQTRPPDEIVIAAWKGDAPTGAVVEALREEAAVVAPPWIRVCLTEDNSVTAKENAALASATGSIVCFLDDDAVARPDWIDRIVAWYGDATVGAVGGRDVAQLDLGVIDEPARDVGRVCWFGRLMANHHRRSVGVREVDFLKGVNMSFRKDLLPPIDRRLAGAVPYGFEIDLGLYVRRLGYRLVYDPEIVVDHYSTSEYGASSPIAWTVNHNQTYVLLKHLPVARKLAFLAYTFLLGDRNTIGVLRAPFLIARDGWSFADVAAHFAGKLAGMLTYARSLRVPSERSGK